MYYITSFEWKGGLKNIAIPAYEAPEGQPGMVIKSLEIGVENDRKGLMTVEFAMENGTDPIRGPKSAGEFVQKVVRELRFGGYSSSGSKYNFTLEPINGEPLTESMMRKYLLLLKLCGVYTFAPPRIIVEGFAGNYKGDGSLPYGKFLMDKMLQQEYGQEKIS